MKIKQVEWRAYRLPFVGQFSTAQGELGAREGVIIKLEADNGLFGLGEAAPLPEFGGGTVAEVLARLDAISAGLPGMSLETLEAQITEWLEYPEPGVTALACGLDMAACDLLAQIEGLPLAAFLSPTTNFQPPIAIPVNATIAAPDDFRAAQAAAQAVSQGFGCIKLKVGMAATVGQEIARVGAVRAAIGPVVKLRLDANGAWTAARAIEILRAVAEFEIELVEQPTVPYDLKRLALVRQAVTIPIAAEEPVTGLPAARAIIRAEAADILVIKPMVVGGLRVGRQIIELAQAAGLQAFVTTTLDSGIAIAGALHLAATLSEPRRHCGLATAQLLTDTLVQNLPPVVNGQMVVPTAPGLGVTLTPAAINFA